MGPPLAVIQNLAALAEGRVDMALGPSVMTPLALPLRVEDLESVWMR